MSISRRRFFASAGAVGAAIAASDSIVPAASPASVDDKPLKFTLGLVTYNMAAQWDLPTLLNICKDVGISPIELRTTHAHGVEPSLGKEQREDVKKQFADSGVQLWGCGTVCEFQSPRSRRRRNEHRDVQDVRAARRRPWRKRRESAAQWPCPKACRWRRRWSRSASR
jgi:hypothetical protein